MLWKTKYSKINFVNILPKHKLYLVKNSSPHPSFKQFTTEYYFISFSFCFIIMHFLKSLHCWFIFSRVLEKFEPVNFRTILWNLLPLLYFQPTRAFYPWNLLILDVAVLILFFSLCFVSNKLLWYTLRFNNLSFFRISLYRFFSLSVSLLLTVSEG